MRTIEEYVELSKNKENISDGGSDCFRFDEDGVVLVKYDCDIKYGDPRENEEKISEAANFLNSKGVNTPKHLAIYRFEDDKKRYCYVLQEIAKGKCMTNYIAKYGDNEGSIEKLRYFSELVKDEQLEKYLKDLIYLFKMGIELKPKNFFYDVDAGFTIIDLLNYNTEGANLDNFTDIKMLFRMFTYSLIVGGITKYTNGATEEHLDRSYKYKVSFIDRLFKTFEHVVPNFDRYRRNLYRCLPEDEIYYMKKYGYLNENLTLTDEEVNEFDNNIEKIVNRYLKELIDGKHTYSEITVNEIRCSSDSIGLSDIVRYHPNFDNMFDLSEPHFSISYELEKTLIKYFNNKIKEAVLLFDDNENLQKAYQEVLDREAFLKRLEENKYKEDLQVNNEIKFY